MDKSMISTAQHKRFRSNKSNFQSRQLKQTCPSSVMSTIRIHPLKSSSVENYLNDAFLMSSENKLNFLSDKDTLNSMFRKFTNRSYVKKKGSKVQKKKSVRNCELGVGFESKPLDPVPQTKLMQQFFPTRTIALLKKLAFMNQFSTIASSKPEKQKNRNKLIFYQQTKPWCRRQKTSIQLRSCQSQQQLKIKSIVQVSKSVHFNSQCSEQQLAKKTKRAQSLLRQRIMKKNIDALKIKCFQDSELRLGSSKMVVPGSGREGGFKGVGGRFGHRDIRKVGAFVAKRMSKVQQNLKSNSHQPSSQKININALLSQAQPQTNPQIATLAPISSPHCHAYHYLTHNQVLSPWDYDDHNPYQDEEINRINRAARQ